jgi:hypothetical protein
MSARPASIVADIPVNLKRPRNFPRDLASATGIIDKVWTLLEASSGPG